MTDRELLEKAAKAAGMPSPMYKDGWFYSDVGPLGEGLYKSTDRSHHQFWNPLTDDGDALRLAVQLGIALASFKDMFAANGLTEYRLSDDYAATRRAIVRAAAEIGKTQ